MPTVFKRVNDVLGMISVAALVAHFFLSIFGGLHFDIYHVVLPGYVPARMGFGRTAGHLTYVAPRIKTLDDWSHYVLVSSGALWLLTRWLIKRSNASNL